MSRTITKAWLTGVLAEALRCVLSLPLSDLPSYDTHIFSRALRSYIIEAGLPPALAQVLESASQVHEELLELDLPEQSWVLTTQSVISALSSISADHGSVDPVAAYLILRRAWLDDDGRSFCPSPLRHMLRNALQQVGAAIREPVECAPAYLPALPRKDLPPDKDRWLTFVMARAVVRTASASKTPSSNHVADTLTHPWFVRDMIFLGLNPRVADALGFLREAFAVRGLDLVRSEQMEARAKELAAPYARMRPTAPLGERPAALLGRIASRAPAVIDVPLPAVPRLTYPDSPEYRVTDGTAALSIRPSVKLRMSDLVVESHVLHFLDGEDLQIPCMRLGCVMRYSRASRWLGSATDEIIMLIEDSQLQA